MIKSLKRIIKDRVDRDPITIRDRDTLLRKWGIAYKEKVRGGGKSKV